MSQGGIRIGFRYTSVQIQSNKRNCVQNILVSLFTRKRNFFTGKKYPPRCVDEIKRKENKVIDHSDR